MIKKRFETWLKEQKARDDNVAVLALFAIDHVRHWPEHETLDVYSALFESLRELSSTYKEPHEIPKLDELRKALDRAWWEWRSTLGGQEFP